MPATLDFYFFIGSTYTWLSVSRAAKLASDHDVELRWCPFSARTLMREQNNVPFAGKPVKLRYMWRDLERRAERLGVPFAGIPPYPIDADEITNRVATLAALEGWCPEATQAIYRTWFLEHRDPGQEDTLRTVLAALGRDPDDCLRQADTPRVREAYASRTAMARELGIFGSPTFACGTEIFWGDDRLEDALDWHGERPVSE